jgi:K+-transporting ATPase A subunit
MHDVKISSFTRSSIYVYDISRLMVTNFSEYLHNDISVTEVNLYVQATLVIRDLTLRVFAITLFRKEQSSEKIVQ